MRTKLVHKCIVYKEDEVWVVKDHACGDFAENRNWRRAVYIGIYHFQLELSDGISRALAEIR